jgi:hypothetical protein
MGGKFGLEYLPVVVATLLCHRSDSLHVSISKIYHQASTFPSCPSSGNAGPSWDGRRVRVSELREEFIVG